MDNVARLVAVEEIKKLKARYFRGIDEKDRAILDSIFTDDVVIDYRGAATDPKTGANAVPGATGALLKGLKPAVDEMMRAVRGFVSVHHGMMPEIEVTSDRTAHAIWPMSDILRFPPGGPISELVGHGHYHETYECVAGQWKIKTLRLTRLVIDVT